MKYKSLSDDASINEIVKHGTGLSNTATHNFARPFDREIEDANRAFMLAYDAYQQSQAQ